MCSYALLVKKSQRLRTFVRQCIRDGIEFNTTHKAILIRVPTSKREPAQAKPAQAKPACAYGGTPLPKRVNIHPFGPAFRGRARSFRSPTEFFLSSGLPLSVAVDASVRPTLLGTGGRSPHRPVTGFQVISDGIAPELRNFALFTTLPTLEGLGPAHASCARKRKASLRNWAGYSLPV